MIKTNFLVFRRSLKNNALFVILNVVGLAIGIAASALIFHYIQFEKSFDKHHTNSENIYRLSYGRLQDSGDDVEFASACPIIAPLLKENFPEIEKIARMANREVSFSFEETNFVEKKVYYAEQEILEILNFELIQGSYKEALTKPNQIILSQKLAHKFFGNSNAVGKTIELNKKEKYIIVAVYKDNPYNTHFKPEALLSFPNLADWRGEEYLESWGHTGAYTYLTLNAKSNPRELEKKFIKLTEDEIGEWLKQYEFMMYFNLQPIESIHLQSHLLQEYEENGSAQSVQFMYLIGFFILIIAWVNYINLTTSTAIKRSHEIGVRKVNGAEKQHLVRQFYFESTLKNLAGVLLSIILILVCNPFFSKLTGVPIDYWIWNKEWFYLFISGVFILGTFITSLYPIFVLSAYNPLNILRGNIISKPGGIYLRKSLILSQLIISILLITGTFAVFSQLKHLRSQDKGFNANNTLVVKAPKAVDSTIVTQRETFKHELLKIPGIEKAVFSTEVPGRKIYWDNGGIFKEGLTPADGKNYMIMGVDEQFVDMYELKLAAGRNFSKDFPSDKKAVLINKTALKHLEFSNVEDALNKNINYWGNIYTIIGVLEDYKHESSKVLSEPQIFRYLPNIPPGWGCFSIKINHENIKSALSDTEALWSQIFPGNALEYFFLDTFYDEQFNADRKFGKVFALFAFLAILITFLGLFGLSTFMTSLKTKDFSIRKVHGASKSNLIIAISREYVNLIIIALIVSAPILIWGIKQWLNVFPEKMQFSLGLIFIPVLIITLTTGISILSQIIRIAILNPVKTLKHN